MTADVIRVPMPALTEETRRDMQKKLLAMMLNKHAFLCVIFAVIC